MDVDSVEELPILMRRTISEIEDSMMASPEGVAEQSDYEVWGKSVIGLLVCRYKFSFLFQC